jgi:hypothetical protein
VTFFTLSSGMRRACHSEWSWACGPANRMKITHTPSPGPLRLVKAPAAGHPLPQGGEGSDFRESGARNAAPLCEGRHQSQIPLPRLWDGNDSTL